MVSNLDRLRGPQRNMRIAVPVDNGDMAKAVLSLPAPTSTHLWPRSQQGDLNLSRQQKPRQTRHHELGRQAATLMRRQRAHHHVGPRPGQGANTHERAMPLETNSGALIFCLLHHLLNRVLLQSLYNKRRSGRPWSKWSALTLVMRL
jgi:hypothetical protein